MLSHNEEKLIPITGLTLEALLGQLSDMDISSYRAKQIFQWIFQKKVSSFSEMTNISKDLKALLATKYRIPRPKLKANQVSKEDSTRKFLFELEDGKAIETVLIPRNGRLTQCLSSQVGCAMACEFCNTGKMGLLRNLKTHEIMDQVLEPYRILGSMKDNFDSELTNVVFMGMGEPLHNLDRVVDAVDILMEDIGIGLSQKRITVSTSGLVKKIDEFGRRSKVNLAISLNATTDELRSQIMPINRRYPISELLASCKRYPLDRKRKITFEYVLLGGMNDSLEDAKRLVGLLSNIPSKINLIPYNTDSDNRFSRPNWETVKKFQHFLLNKNMNATIRISKGQDILAACGQLYAEAKR